MSFYRSYTLLLSLPVFMHSWQMQVTFPRWNSTHLSSSCCFVLETYVTIVCNNHSKTSRRLTYTGVDESKQFLFSSVSVLLNSSELYSVLVDVIVTVIMCFDSSISSKHYSAECPLRAEPMHFIHVAAQIIIGKVHTIEPQPLTEVRCDTVIQLKQAVEYWCLPRTAMYLYIVGVSLSEPHTSVTAFAEVVCMYVCLCVCGHIP